MEALWQPCSSLSKSRKVLTNLIDAPGQRISLSTDVAPLPVEDAIPPTVSGAASSSIDGIIIKCVNYIQHTCLLNCACCIQA